jgi:hypothetical protein
MGGFTETEKMKRHVEQCDQCKIAHLASNGIAYSEYCDTYAEMFENVIDFECGDDIGYWLTEKMVAKLVDPYSKAREAEVDKAAERPGEQADVKWEIGAKYEVLPAERGEYGVVATLVRIGTVSTGHGDVKSGLIFRDDSGKRIEVATLARVIRRVQ